MTNLNRREFLKISALSAGVLFISTAIAGCGGSSTAVQSYIPVKFLHGVASGDPLNDKVIIWTRATPSEDTNQIFNINYEVSTDQNFTNIIREGIVSTSVNVDYTIKIDIQDLEPNTTYYYRFKSADTLSSVGKTKTLPVGNIEQVKIAVFSCANYTNGYFNAYDAAGKIEGIDLCLQVGDYIYEYGMYESDGVTPAYATQDAQEIGRVLPQDNDKECISLEDYRKRYALYHMDEGLQNLRKMIPFAVVWDDHETANDAYVDGAQNHQEDEGSWDERVASALQAYFEWLPIRPIEEKKKIYRSFNFGDLVSINILETRLNARTKPLSYANYFNSDGTFNSELFQSDLSKSELLGDEQYGWLEEEFTNSSAKWQVLAQQILMAKVNLPAEILAPIGQLDYVQTQEEYDGLINIINTLLGELVDIKIKKLQGDNLTPEEEARLSTVLPYNLDAWDGYAYEREKIFALSKSFDKNLVLLAGDTHNAWASNLTDINGDNIGVEFATPSVTAPGFEDYVALDTLEKAMDFEGAITLLVDDVKYLNSSDRGFMIVTFTQEEAISEWFFVDNYKSKEYELNTNRYNSHKVNINEKKLSVEV